MTIRKFLIKMSGMLQRFLWRERFVTFHQRQMWTREGNEVTINRAISEAIVRKMHIARESWLGYLRVEPTDSSQGCILHDNKNPSSSSCLHWQPTADDLLADDWILVSDPNPLHQPMQGFKKIRGITVEIPNSASCDTPPEAKANMSPKMSP